MIQLVIQFDPKTGACNVSGIPMGQDQAGQSIPIKWIVYAALKSAEKTIDAFDPNAEDKGPRLIVAKGAVPLPANRANGRTT